MSTMPPQAFEKLTVLEPIFLTTDTAIKFAIHELEAAINDLNFDILIDYIVSRPLLLAFLMCATHTESALSYRIMKNFPTSPAAFLSSPLAKVLSCLSRFMSSLPFTLPGDIAQSFKQSRRIVDLSSPVLQELVFVDDSYGSTPDDKLHGISIDPWPFYNLGYSVPRTYQDARDLVVTILLAQKRTLEAYISTLRRPDVSEMIKKAYIPSYSGFEDERTEEHRTDEMAPKSTAVENQNSHVSPAVQPMKAALGFGSAKGLGEWMILISGGAQKALRETRRRDTQSFKTILHKIRALSKGRFSADNHTQLNDEGEIPIYEAKITRDLRLVYQVDCVAHDLESEKQVIKIFGIYTDANLDSCFWNSMSSQLTRKGKEYIRRCKFENREHKSPNGVVLPASFPPQLDNSPSDPQSSMAMDFSQDNLNEIHCLLGFGKYVTVSQPLLYSIFADLEVQHVFQVSRREMEIIEHPSSSYVIGRSGTGKTTSMLFKILYIEKAWTAQPNHTPKPRQLFVTKSSALAYKVEEYFADLVESLGAASLSPVEIQELAKAKKRDREREEVLVSKTDRVMWQKKLPAHFGLLEDEHFPLFISFDRLCELLQEHKDDSADGCAPHVAESGPNIRKDNYKLSRRPRGIFVSYPVFRRSYWPHLGHLTKGLDCFLVFNEILGVIRGSEAALHQNNGFMTRQDYENLSCRSRSTFASLRSTVYTIFESYLKEKQRRRDYDAADRVYSILNHEMPKRKVDFIYVDEAQDNLLVDALLLRKLCRNPNGLFWAGDTAQTISAGSSFSFNELKSFLFRYEEMRRRSQPLTFGSTSKAEPRMFQLPVNYRSHAGIVNCAQSVIELITRFWPHSIDTLAPERGTVDGVKPVFFSYEDQDETANIETFLFGSSGKSIEFGAQQCIIVRDQAAMDRLQERGIGGNSIMTLYETKGLEFNDVLLYNFFHDSTADMSQWRVILNVLDKPAPDFDEVRHAGLCSELKSLYVAITRARMNLWIVDVSEQSKPMKDFWSSRELVRLWFPGMTIPHLAVKSSKEEWAAQAQVYFDKEEYYRAMSCFEKASMRDKAAVAQAYHLREDARMMTSESRQRSKALVNAAEVFRECAKTTAKREYLRTAAECYDSAGELRRAAQSYEEAEAFDIAAQRYCNSKTFEAARRVIDKHERMMSTHVVNGVKDKIRLHYFENNELPRALELFASSDDALAFTKKHRLEEARFNLLHYLGMFAAAAELRLSQNRILEAIQCFFKDIESEHSRHGAIRSILQGLWRQFSLRTDLKQARTSEDVHKLLEFAAKLDRGFWSSKEYDELSIFRAIVSEDLAQLMQLGEIFYYDHANSLAATVLCFDLVYNHPSQIHDLTRHNFLATFKTFFVYVANLTEMANDPSPTKNPEVQKLLTFHFSKNQGCYFVPRQTYLHGLLKTNHVPTLQSNNDGKWVLTEDLSRIIKTNLGHYTRRKVSGMIKELVSSITDAENWSLSAALIFIRHMFLHQVPASATDLCDFLDCICCFLAFTVRGHEVRLPRRWHRNISGNYDQRDARLLPLLTTSIRELVEQVLDPDGADHIHFEPPYILDTDGFISRIFEAICVFGYNMPIGAKLEILRVITLSSEILPKSRQYADAETWRTMLRLVKVKAEGTIGENSSAQKPRRLEKGKKIPETGKIENLSDHSPIAQKSINRREVELQDNLPVADPTSTKISFVNATDSRGNVGGSHHPLAVAVSCAVEEDATPRSGVEVDNELLGDVDTVEFGSQEYVRWATHFSIDLTEQEIHAATVILRAYRSAIYRRQGRPKAGLPKARARLYALYWEEARNIQWRNGGSYYRKLFLGPLPHLLLCVQEIGKHAKLDKDRVKKKTLIAKGDELDELNKQQTELTHLIKDITKIHRSLEPKADLHRKCDVAILREYLSQVRPLMGQLPPDKRKNLDSDFVMAAKGIAPSREDEYNH